MNAPRQVRILVLRGGALGDFIVTLPALAALRERWPGAHLELVGYPHLAGLALRAGLVDRVTSLHGAGIARLFSLRPEFPPEQYDYVRSFDLVVSYLHDPDGLVVDHLRRLGARQVLHGSPMIAGGHAVDQLLKPLETLAIYGAGAAPRLALPAADIEAGRRALAEAGADPARAWVFHPGSGSPAKNWPTDRFVALARRLAETKRGVPVFLTGEADETASAHLAQCAADFPRVANRALGDVAGLLAAASAYIGNDSGITHLAAALGVPALALFGPSNADHWAPRGPRVAVLCAPGGDLAQLSVDEVWTRCSTMT